MGNGMYCEIEAYCCEVSDEERLHDESRRTLEYLKTAYRRLKVLIKRQAHFKRNPLGAAMCKEVEAKIYQQTLLIDRFQGELCAMVERYNHANDAQDSTQASMQADWEEVMQMARMPMDVAVARTQQLQQQHNSSGSAANASSGSSINSLFNIAHCNSPAMSGTTAMGSDAQKTFPMQMTPPIEHVVELRQRLRQLEQSPLFTDACPKPPPKLLPAVLATGQQSPYSLP